MLEPMPAASSPAAIVIMGVSGSGKTEIGSRLAERLGWAFRDADEFHPAENIAKMRAGVPLVDADREPWLAALAAVLERAVTEGPPLVLACSALKRGHRTRLGLPRTSIRLVHLDGVTLLLEPAGDGAFGDALSESGHLDGDGHVF
jgi:carbohydrate kinase (thermoresistant glucokinase family)